MERGRDVKIRADRQRRLLRSRAPSFRGFKPSSPASSRAKAANRARSTAHELKLQEALCALGLRFETYREDLPGCPDIVFPNEKIVVFCDGDFWHGRHWARLRSQLARRANALYWLAKIGANRARDRRVRTGLRRQGWTVIQLWETDILRDPRQAASSLKERLGKKPSPKSGRRILMAR
jgi:DNA mismatch endonuclease (patch repair protein)